jgi:hypothetical protein
MTLIHYRVEQNVILKAVKKYLAAITFAAPHLQQADTERSSNQSRFYKSLWSVVFADCCDRSFRHHVKNAAIGGGSAWAAFIVSTVTKTPISDNRSIPRISLIYN